MSIQLENFVFANWANKVNYSSGDGEPSHSPALPEFYFDETGKIWHIWNTQEWSVNGESKDEVLIVDSLQTFLNSADSVSGGIVTFDRDITIYFKDTVTINYSVDFLGDTKIMGEGYTVYIGSASRMHRWNTSSVKNINIGIGIGVGIGFIGDGYFENCSFLSNDNFLLSLNTNVKRLEFKDCAFVCSLDNGVPSVPNGGGVFQVPTQSRANLVFRNSRMLAGYLIGGTGSSYARIVLENFRVQKNQMTFKHVIDTEGFFNSIICNNVTFEHSSDIGDLVKRRSSTQFMNGIITMMNGQMYSVTDMNTVNILDTGTYTSSRAMVTDSSGKITTSNVTSTELGYLDGVTSAIQTQIDGKQASITGGATTIDTENLTASRALISNSSGKVAVSSVTSTELSRLDGVTSSVQNQLNGKVSTSNFNGTCKVFAYTGSFPGSETTTNLWNNGKFYVQSVRTSTTCTVKIKADDNDAQVVYRNATQGNWYRVMSKYTKDMYVEFKINKGGTEYESFDVVLAERGSGTSLVRMSGAVFCNDSDEWSYFIEIRTS